MVSLLLYVDIYIFFFFICVGSETLLISSFHSFSSSYDGHEEDGGFDGHGETASIRVNGGDNPSKDAKTIPRQIPTWLSVSTPDEFVV